MNIVAKTNNRRIDNACKHNYYVDSLYFLQEINNIQLKKYSFLSLPPMFFYPESQNTRKVEYLIARIKEHIHCVINSVCEICLIGFCSLGFIAVLVRHELPQSNTSYPFMVVCKPEQPQEFTAVSIGFEKCARVTNYIEVEKWGLPLTCRLVIRIFKKLYFILLNLLVYFFIK